MIMGDSCEKTKQKNCNFHFKVIMTLNWVEVGNLGSPGWDSRERVFFRRVFLEHWLQVRNLVSWEFTNEWEKHQ